MYGHKIDQTFFFMAVINNASDTRGSLKQLICHLWSYKMLPMHVSLKSHNQQIEKFEK